MKHPLTLALAIALGTAASPALAQTADTAPARSTSAEALKGNPFAVESTLPLQYPHFDRIRDEHFAPAFDAGMAEQLAEVRAIADNPEPATFENTIIPLEKSGAVLGRAMRVFFNLVGTDTNDTRKKLQADYSAKFAAHRDAISLDPKLFARIKALHDDRANLGLDAEGVRLVEEYYKDLVRAGAALDEGQKARLKAINAELATLGTKFSQNVLAEVNDSAVVVDTAEELEGLTPEQIQTAANAAKARGHEGKYVITLLNTTGQPPLSQLANRELRERIHKASVARGARGNQWDNRELVARVLELRAERAKMLGFDTYADYVLDGETA